MARHRIRWPPCDTFFSQKVSPCHGVVIQTSPIAVPGSGYYKQSEGLYRSLRSIIRPAHWPPSKHISILVHVLSVPTDEYRYASGSSFSVVSNGANDDVQDELRYQILTKIKTFSRYYSLGRPLRVSIMITTKRFLEIRCGGYKTIWALC